MSITHPRENLSQLGLQEGEIVADFGAGSGHYAIPAGEKVGEDGQVYAVEIQKKLVSKVKTRAQKAGLNNVDVLWADLEAPEGSGLDDESVDVVLAANVLFQLKDKEAFLREVRRVLKSGGRLLIVDWTDSHGGLGPNEEHLIIKSEAEQRCQQAGFVISEEIDAGAHHYGFTCRKE